MNKENKQLLLLLAGAAVAVIGLRYWMKTRQRKDVEEAKQKEISSAKEPVFTVRPPGSVKYPAELVPASIAPTINEFSDAYTKPYRGLPVKEFDLSELPGNPNEIIF
jgi:hypothetical protein